MMKLISNDDEVDKLKLINDHMEVKKPDEKEIKRYSEEIVDWYTMWK